MLASMHAMVLRNPGPDADFVATECPLPTPGPGQVRIRVAASSVNPLDLKLASGQVPLLPPAPCVLHGDVAGVIDAVGDDVLAFSPGDEVLGFAGGVAAHPGALADYMLADERLITRKPRRLSFMEAAALPAVFITAWQALVERGRLEAGQRVLIHGGAGGVGHVALQIARCIGAEVATTVSSDDKARAARDCGADHVIRYREEAVADYVARLTGGEGFDLVFDCVGGKNLAASFAASKLGGRIVTINARTTVDLSPLHAGSRSLEVLSILLPLTAGIGHEQQRQALGKLVELVEEGEFKVRLDERQFDFSEVAEAHRHQASGKAVGKISLVRRQFWDAAQ